MSPLTLSLPEEFGPSDGNPPAGTKRHRGVRPDRRRPRILRWLACWAGRDGTRDERL